VFVVGDAERMVPQEGADQAANAFLKLLEEPPADTTLLLTTSEPGALLPTIRSRVVSVRVPALTEGEMREILALPAFAAALDRADVPGGVDARLAAAGGAPGRLLGSAMERDALETARALLGSLREDRAAQMRAVLALGGSRARGFFSRVLDALTVLLRSRAEEAARRGERVQAVAAARAVDLVEEAKARAAGNVNPQLLGASLLRGFVELRV
jgi:DNA polymerase-3 subunit delta'